MSETAVETIEPVTSQGARAKSRLERFKEWLIKRFKKTTILPTETNPKPIEESTLNPREYKIITDWKIGRPNVKDEEARLANFIEITEAARLSQERIRTKGERTKTGATPVKKVA